MTAILHWTNYEQPDEGNEWTNRASFLSEDEAKRAGLALTSNEVRAAYIAVVQIFGSSSDKPIAQYEYVRGFEQLIFDERSKPLFHGKLGSA